MLPIEKDRFAIEVGNEGGIDLAAVDRLQDRNNGLRRFEAAQVHMHRIGRPPYPGIFRGSSASHSEAPFLRWYL